MSHLRSLVMISIHCNLLFDHSVSGQEIDWVKQIGGAEWDLIAGLCQDGNGSIYSTGTLEAAMSPPGSYITDQWYPIAGSKDIYVARFSPAGELDWAVIAGGSAPPGVTYESEYGQNILFDSLTSSLIVQGGYQSQLSSFGNDQTLSGRGQFVAKYSTTGVCTWVRDVGWGRPNDIAVDSFGSIYAMGYRHELYDDNFLVKYDSTGNEIWTKIFGSGATGQLVMDGDTLVMATTVEADDELFGVSFSAIASGDAVILRMDTAATIISMQQYGSDSLARITDMALAPDGTLLIAGSFFQSLQLPMDTLYSDHGHEVRFLIKADRQGVPYWVKTFEVQDYDGPVSWPKVSLAPDSTIHLLLDLRGSTVVDIDTLLPNADRDLMIIQFSWNGVLEGIFHQGEIQTSRVISSTSDGSILFGGTFSASLLIGAGLTSNGGLDAFIARLSSIATTVEYKSSPSGALQIYANPNDGTCTIELPEELRFTQGLMLYIHDAQGRLVQSIPLRKDQGRVALDIRAQAKGVYPVQVSDGRQRYSGTIVFE